MSDQHKMSMSQSYKAFIFDLDGVIVDTARYHFLSWRQLATQMNFEIPDSLDEDLKGLGRMESLDKVLAFYSGSVTDEEKTELARRKNDMYLDNISHISPGDTLPGVEEFIRTARERGIKTSLGSGSKNAKAIIARLGIEDLFDAMCDGTDISRSKPDPQIFQCACAALGVEPSDAVVFEDATSGIEAAKRCGTATVGVGDESILGDADTNIPGFEGISVDSILESLS